MDDLTGIIIASGVMLLSTYVIIRILIKINNNSK